jgi:hypothetical protein
MECWGCVCRCYLLLLQHWQAVTQTIYRCLRSSLQQQHCFINVPDAWTWVKKTQIMLRHMMAALLNCQVTGKYTCMSTYRALRFVFSVNDVVYTLIICTLYLYVQRKIQTFVNRCLKIYITNMVAKYYFQQRSIKSKRTRRYKFRNKKKKI